VGADGAHLEGLDRVLEVVDRAGRRGEVEDGVQRAGDVDEVGHVHADQPEPLADQVLDVAQASGEEVVHADDVPALGQQPAAQVGPEEAGAARDQRARHASRSRGRSASAPAAPPRPP
jgi:hypothetical protein